MKPERLLSVYCRRSPCRPGRQVTPPLSATKFLRIYAAVYTVHRKYWGRTTFAFPPA